MLIKRIRSGESVKIYGEIVIQNLEDRSVEIGFIGKAKVENIPDVDPSYLEIP